MRLLDGTDAFAKWLERFISGPSPNDPLYVSNRSWGQKLRLGLVIAVPVGVLAAVLVVTLGNPFADTSLRAAKAPPMPKPGEITANVLPDLDKTYRSDSDSDCEVVEAGVAGQALVGKVRNNSDHEIAVADLVFDVTDGQGSQLGAVAVRVQAIPAHGIVPFHQPLPQHNAQTALVREIHTR